MRACRANYRLSIRVRSVGLRGPLWRGAHPVHEPTSHALQFSLQYSPPTVVRYASSGTVEVASSAQGTPPGGLSPARVLPPGE